MFYLGIAMLLLFANHYIEKATRKERMIHQLKSLIESVKIDETVNKDIPSQTQNGILNEQLPADTVSFNSIK